MRRELPFSLSYDFAVRTAFTYDAIAYRAGHPFPRFPDFGENGEAHPQAGEYDRAARDAIPASRMRALFNHNRIVPRVPELGNVELQPVAPVVAEVAVEQVAGPAATNLPAGRVLTTKHAGFGNWHVIDTATDNVIAVFEAKDYPPESKQAKAAALALVAANKAK